MIGKIDNKGRLWIQRPRGASNEWRQMRCRGHCGNYDCEDLCPMFDEPELDNFSPKTILRLCKRTMYFSVLIDERKIVSLELDKDRFNVEI